jgi:hypothetical protein
MDSTIRSSRKIEVLRNKVDSPKSNNKAKRKAKAYNYRLKLYEEITRAQLTSSSGESSLPSSEEKAILPKLIDESIAGIKLKWKERGKRRIKQ